MHCSGTREVIQIVAVTTTVGSEWQAVSKDTADLSFVSAL